MCSCRELNMAEGEIPYLQGLHGEEGSRGSTREIQGARNDRLICAGLSLGCWLDLLGEERVIACVLTVHVKHQLRESVLVFDEHFQAWHTVGMELL